MKNFFLSLILVLLAFCPAVAQDAPRLAKTSQKKVVWLTDYKEGRRLAAEQNKPILLFFSGMDWCAWCKKLNQEVLKQKAFADRVADRFIFVNIDFPMYKPLPAQQLENNQKLKEEMNVQGYPTIILLDPEGHRIAVTGYRNGGPKRYANYLLEEVRKYKSLNSRVNELYNTNYSSEELEQLYAEASRFGRDDLAEKVLLEGIKTRDNSFFLLEKYRLLVEGNRGEGDKFQESETQTLRKQILSSVAPEKLVEISYRVAVIDFQALSENLDEVDDPSDILYPLLGYLSDFQHADKDHTWRVQMMVSQVYLKKKRYSEALKFSKAALKTAPESFQVDIQRAVDNVEARLAKRVEARLPERKIAEVAR